MRQSIQHSSMHTSESRLPQCACLALLICRLKCTCKAEPHSTVYPALQAMHATGTCSTAGSQPRAQATAFYHHPFAIDSPFKELRQLPLDTNPRTADAQRDAPVQVSVVQHAYSESSNQQLLCASAVALCSNVPRSGDKAPLFELPACCIALLLPTNQWRAACTTMHLCVCCRSLSRPMDMGMLPQDLFTPQGGVEVGCLPCPRTDMRTLRLGML
jgi:hypothetical protein